MDEETPVDHGSPKHDLSCVLFLAVNRDILESVHKPVIILERTLCFFQKCPQISRWTAVRFSEPFPTTTQNAYVKKELTRVVGGGISCPYKREVW